MYKSSPKIGNIKVIKKYDWKSSDTNTEGTYTNYEDLDCGFMPIHQYFKFIKYGYGRATDHACHEIRQGRLTLQQGKELIIEYDGKVPQKYFKVWFHVFISRPRLDGQLIKLQLADSLPRIVDRSYCALPVCSTFAVDCTQPESG